MTIKSILCVWIYDRSDVWDKCKHTILNQHFNYKPKLGYLELHTYDVLLEEVQLSLSQIQDVGTQHETSNSQYWPIVWAEDGKANSVVMCLLIHCRSQNRAENWNTGAQRALRPDVKKCRAP